jgi:hypothetical protein
MTRIVIHTELDGTQTVLTDAPGGIDVMMIDQRKWRTGRVHVRVVQSVGSGFIDALLHRSESPPEDARPPRGRPALAVIDGGRN